MRPLDECAIDLLRWLQETDGTVTVAELSDRLAVDRGLLDGALGELDDARLVRIHGGASTSHSIVELTDVGARVARDTGRRAER